MYGPEREGVSALLVSGAVVKVVCLLSLNSIWDSSMMESVLKKECSTDKPKPVYLWQSRVLSPLCSMHMKST